MNKEEWKPSEQVINNQPCVEHVFNANDLQIFGQNGVLMRTGATNFRALITAYQTFNGLAKHFKLANKAIKGEELIIEFGIDDFDKVYKAIKVPKTLKEQVLLSKQFS